MGKNDTNYKLLTRILKNAAYYKLENKLNILHQNFFKMNYSRYYENLTVEKQYYSLIIVLFLIIDKKLLTNIIFCKIIKIVGMVHSVTQNQMLGQFFFT